ncbi:MAG: hypothetical protein P1P87_08330 [Trueperaceae bacterium]|nr:hypothetical protein [Trueperaceae bacterium]
MARHIRHDADTGVTTLDEVRAPLEQQLRAERVEATILAYQRASGVATFPDRIPPLGAPAAD